MHHNDRNTTDSIVFVNQMVTASALLSLGLAVLVTVMRAVTSKSIDCYVPLVCEQVERSGCNRRWLDGVASARVIQKEHAWM